jgi:hypothetical protein
MSVESPRQKAVTNLEVKVASVGSRLSGGLRELLSALPDRPKRPRDIQKTLGIKKDVASRIARATDQVDPLAAVLVMPGPLPLRQVVGAAKNLGVRDTILTPIAEAVDEFESLIRDEIGDRVAFDGVVSSLLPEARARQDILCRQMVFRGMMQVKGVCADVMLTTAFIWPSQTPRRLDGVFLLGWYGLCRMRPGVAVRFAMGAIGPLEPSSPFQSIRGEKVSRPGQLILREHSSIGEEDLQVQPIGRAMHCVLAGDRVGSASAANLTVAMYTPECLSTVTEHAEPRANGPTVEISTPCRQGVFDVLIHRDVLPGVDPTLLVYDTTIQGLADMNDPNRDIDRIDTTDEIARIDLNRTGVRVQEIPGYPEMLRQVCDARGWNLSAFRMYRCLTKYPVYGAQYAFAFPVPHVSSEGAGR